MGFQFKWQSSLVLKLIVLGTSIAFLLLFLLIANPSSAAQRQPAALRTDQISAEMKATATGEAIQAGRPPSTAVNSSCAKISPSLAHALIYYATVNVTPQQTFQEISVAARVLERKSPCRFLVFGLGHDSLMWAALNHGGRTAFLEENQAWIDRVTARFPALEAHHVVYNSSVRQAGDLMEEGRREKCRALGDPGPSKCGLALRGVPSSILEVEWDAIMVDAPTGYFPDAPGRMGAIYTAGMMGRNRREGETDVFVHDVDREVEDSFSREFLCEGYMREQVGRLRHFVLPSHRADPGIPFCPPQSN